MTTDSSLLAQAREWQVLLHSGRASAADRIAAEAWRCASPAHEQAASEVDRLWALLGQLGEQPPVADSPAVVLPLRRGRRRRWAVPLASAAMLLLALWLPQGAWVGWYADLETAPGEVRIVELEDGTVLTLNGATALDWSISEGRRSIRLYRGEADFQVAKDASRPFFVEAGPARIRVTGTRFDVDYSGRQVVLAVTEGQVQASDAREQPLPVGANQQVRWSGDQMEPVQPLDARQQLAWQRGKLVFRAQPLSEVFAELERSQSQRVIFLDQSVRDLKVTGVFAHDDPQAVLRAIESNLPVRLVRLPGLLLVSRN
ncbi:transmembrane sensor [Pseudomonas sp. BIGb0408]|uniref:Transmembrane sensor n=1 Tax=Phytopseudomonas flavescens TaxID=29435 RepID=A0A7Z0BSN8_9GAMM|nr:FecR domain-containing protein [Pseudomonas sp. BIGb0408]MCW2294507.1 transmembrane sensor [Pseudomonas sp. BIGb0408]NYH76219.1 transmembrane sensor [Pseudomonas flavescens]